MFMGSDQHAFYRYLFLVENIWEENYDKFQLLKGIKLQNYMNKNIYYVVFSF